MASTATCSADGGHALDWHRSARCQPRPIFSCLTGHCRAWRDMDWLQLRHGQTKQAWLNQRLAGPSLNNRLYPTPQRTRLWQPQVISRLARVKPTVGRSKESVVKIGMPHPQANRGGVRGLHQPRLRREVLVQRLVSRDIKLLQPPRQVSLVVRRHRRLS